MHASALRPNPGSAGWLAGWLPALGAVGGAGRGVALRKLQLKIVSSGLQTTART